MINSYHEKDYPNSDRFIPEDRNIIINQIYKKKLREGQFVYIELVQYLTCIFHTLGKKPLIDEWHTPAKAVFSFYDKSLQP